MICRVCGAKNRVVSTEQSGDLIRRRRECDCERWTTYEGTKKQLKKRGVM